MLSACGAPQTAQTLIQAHTACDPAYYSTPVWSPDGLTIDYVAAVGGMTNIRSMSALGRDDHVLIPDASAPLPSPDGKSLLFLSTDPSSPAQRDGLLDLATGQVRTLGDLGQSPAWSPDSRWIAHRPMNGGPLLTLDVAAGTSVALMKSAAGMAYGDNHPAWSPDGRRIAFSSDRNGSMALYVVNADGSSPTVIARQSSPACPGAVWQALAIAPGWSPDGGLLAYVYVCNIRAALHLITPGGDEVTGRNYLFNNVAASGWSPDGKRILVLANNAGQTKLVVANVDGSDLNVVRSNALDPRWSPDGRQIVFVGYDQVGLQEIYTMAPDGSGVTQLTQNPGAGGLCLH